ncbi:ATP-binding cassette, subfamily B [Anaerosporobacter mobilis DSM 15930]|uniref:ATP-binding cassette, subfamily B n=1 Tax=Anaerosporobacter mobilis DSM 15930 TaxID=1120996 RepID=A0A1M7MU37_9FIRM|nr:ABC transporter ATP-binding protein [Anaerosporobacter mobilis]SHM94635.1 ATP-binding cassette, subfamily B [Anaerosporobacter mobilis DSM 15930]
MKKLMRYLKPFRLSILAVVVLLVIQAFSDLSLPQYTSDIVDVGIQQGGIEDTALEAVRVSTYQKMQYFMSSEDSEYLSKYYKYVGKDSSSESEYKEYIKDYPILESEDIYVLDTKDKEVREKISSIIAKPLFISAVLDGSISMGDDSGESGDDSDSMSFLPPELEGQDVFAALSMMTEEQVAQLNEEINVKLKEVPESILDQGAVTIVKLEYEAIGIDVGKIQNNYIAIAGFKMIGLAIVGMIAAIIVGYLASRIAAGTSKNIRGKVFEKVVGFSNAEFDKFSTASLITRSTNDIQQVQMLLVMMFRMVLYAPILGIGGIIKVTNTETSMAWIIAVAVGTILVLVGTLMIIAMPKFKSMQKLVDRLNLVTREILTGLPVIRAFSREKHEEKRFDIANKDLTRTNLFVNRTMTFMMPIMMFVMNGITLMIIWFGGKGIDSGNLQVGDMMAFIQYTMQIVMSFLMLTMVSIMLPRAAVSANRIMEVLDTQSLINDPKDKKSFNTAKKGVVEFKNMSFRYPNAEEDVLEDINFIAKPGETTAIIGSTGSGKSTLINLIPRLYDATQGEILIDGVNVKDVSQHDLRAKIGFVPQKGVLFSGTIDSNIRYGKQEATEEDIKRAARIAQAQDFIEEKPEQYDEAISQGGSNVSGGQKQRLSIARAIAKDPDIYIFDDSFSALDFKTDATLRKTLHEEITDSTIIIVAQRISTILHAEQIIVLDEGKIVGKGTHAQLLENCDVYRQIASSQLSEKEIEASIANKETVKGEESHE